MNFRNLFKRKIRDQTESTPVSNGGGLTFLRQLLTSGGGSDLSEVTYLTCLKTLSEAMGKLPVEVEDGDHKRLNNDVARLLSVAPNPRQTAAEFFGTLEFCRNHYGNGYAYCSWDERTGALKGLYPLAPQCVTIWVNNTGTLEDLPYYYTYTDSKNGNTYMILPDDMIHLRSWLTDGATHLAGKAIHDILNSYFPGTSLRRNF